MAELSNEELDFIERHTLKLDKIPGQLRDLVHKYDSGGMVDFGPDVKELLTKLAIHEVALKLKATDGDVSSGLIKRLHVLQKEDVHYQHYQTLISHVIQESPSDLAIWRSVRDL